MFPSISENQFFSKRKFKTILFFGIGILFSCAVISVFAYHNAPLLEIELTPIVQPYKSNYDNTSNSMTHRTKSLNYAPHYYLITITNTGGTHRGFIELSGYDTEATRTIPLTLQKNETKQFLVSSDETMEHVRVPFLTSKSYRIKNNVTHFSPCICFGILSDNADNLKKMTFEQFPYAKDKTDFALQAFVLTPEYLKEQLPALTFLLIDNYNTARLPADFIEDIQNWTYNGGNLILGGGSPANKTTSGFREDFLPLKYDIYLHEGHPGPLFSWDYPYPDYPLAIPDAWWVEHFAYYRRTGMSFRCSAGACTLLYFSPCEILTYLDVSANKKGPEGFANILYELTDDLYYVYNRNGCGAHSSFL